MYNSGNFPAKSQYPTRRLIEINSPVLALAYRQPAENQVK